VKVSRFACEDVFLPGKRATDLEASGVVPILLDVQLSVASIMNFVLESCTIDTT
jgi:hypothetical protein